MVAYSRASLLQFDSASSLRDLLWLRQSLRTFQAAAAELEAARGAGSVPRAAGPVRELRRLFDRQAEVLLRLKRNVVLFDREVAGATVGSVAELLLRARALILEAELHRLSDVLSGAVAHTCAQPLFVGRLRQISDVVGVVREQLQQIHRLWRPHRKLAGALTPPGASAPRTYRDRLREASKAVTALGDDPDLAHFLRAGAGSHEWPEVERACGLIAAAIGLASNAPQLTTPDWSDGATTGARVSQPGAPLAHELMPMEHS